MDVREKLVELLGADICKYNYCEDCECFENKEDCFATIKYSMADHLIANGVTVQECKLGDKVYQTDGVRIYESIIDEITFTAKHTIFVTENIDFDERAIGNSIFLSYAEAEAHLR